MNKIIERIHEMVDSAIMKKTKENREYMGTSGLGEPCDRALWYSYHQPKPIDKAIVLRKFDICHSTEPVVIQWLKDAGMTVFTADKDGNQFGFVDGVIAGHVDLVILGIPGDEKTPYLGEVKTANQFNFKKFQKEGLQSHPKYLVQVHVYLNKLKLKKALFIVANKDSQELYFEIVEADEFIAVSALQRGFVIAESTEMPERKYAMKNYFLCKFCNYNSECWSDE